MKHACILTVVVALAISATQAPGAEKGQSRPAGKAAAAKRAQKPAVKKTRPASPDGDKSPSVGERETELELLSGNEPEVLSGNRTHVLSGNSARLVSKVRVLSGIKVYVNITFGAADNNRGGNDPGRAESLFESLDRDGDGKLSAEEFRRSFHARTGPASF